MINELSSALTDFLKGPKVQSMVTKTKRDLAKISKQVEFKEKFKVTMAQSVKPLTPVNYSDGAARDQKSTNHQTMHLFSLKIKLNARYIKKKLILTCQCSVLHTLVIEQFSSSWHTGLQVLLNAWSLVY
jgi:hypothetical protein